MKKSKAKKENPSILVTGAEGFIGSHLTEILVSRGFKVRALCQYNSFSSWGWLESIRSIDEVEVVLGDIRDPAFCRELTQGIDIVFHLAALIAIPFSYVAPDTYVSTNVIGTLNICQAARDSGCQHILHTSTSEVYGTALYVPIDENHPLQPQSPYSASKIGADSIAMSFFKSFEVPVTIVRPFNTYGPRQSNRAVIPTIISQILSGKSQIHLGDVTPTRDFNYVTDTCEAFIGLSECKASIGEIVNVGSNSEISIIDTLERIKAILNSDVEFVVQNDRIRPPKSEVFRLWCDNSKIKKLIQYAPKYSIDQGLEETINWFSKSENLAKYKTNSYNV